jgi:hypothetical protein
MTDKDSHGKALAEKVHAAERRIGKAMSGTINHRELEAARKAHARALEEHRAHESGRSYGSGSGSRDNGE